MVKKGKKEEKKEKVCLAMEGDRDALEWLIRSVQDRIYGLSLKMLYLPPDAEDATQEILIKIVTRLDSYRQESSFDTWAMTIASNHLLNKRKHVSKYKFTFQSCEKMIIRDIPDHSTLIYSKAEQDLLVEEMRISCMQGLLQCLDWAHRIVYILGETMDVSGAEGSAILGITPAAFRKRFSRARERIRNFLSKNCELVHEGNPCECASQAVAAVNHGVMDPDRLQFVTHRVVREKSRNTKAQLREMEGLSREAVLMRAHPDYAAPGAFVKGIRNMLDSGRFHKLRNVN